MKAAPITVVIPTIPPRACPGGLLDQAVASVRAQILQPAGGICAVLDLDRVGPAVIRRRGLDAVRTEWVAYLDDDDAWYPQHLQVLYGLVLDHDADYAYSWFDGNNPFPMHRGKQMDPGKPHHTTMTVLVRTEISRRAGFGDEVEPGVLESRGWVGEDWAHQLHCLNLGARFIGTDQVTWHYRVHGGNTSGIPNRW